MKELVEQRALGRTRLKLSCLGVGGGSAFGRADDGNGAALVDSCWELGLRYFDSAPLYGAGTSERRFGASLSSRPRNEFVLSTKVGRIGPEEFNYSVYGIEQSLAGSYRRLGMPAVDMVMIHDLDPDLHGGEFERRFDEAVTQAAPALAALRAEHTISAFGLGTKNWDVCLRFARLVPVDCFMVAGGYTLLQHGAFTELLPYCQAHGISVVVAAPFNTGILATGAIAGARYYYQPANAQILVRTRKLEAVCARYAVPLAAVALQFPLHHPAVASVVVGHENAGEVERNLNFLRQEIPRALWAELKHQGLLPADAPVPT